MRIMITGAAGGIGSTLAYFLNKSGHDLILIDNLRNGYIENLTIDGFSFGQLEKFDIRDLANRSDLGSFDAVIHLAAITSLADCESNPQETISVNVEGTVSVLEFCRKNSVPYVIFSSTGAVYENNKETVFDETMEVNPRLMYSLSKNMAEQVCESYRVNYDMKITTLRFFNVFGPKQDIHRKTPPLLNYLVKQFSINQVPILYSDGNQVRDYIHVNDVVRLIDICLEKNPNDTFNVCTNTLLSVREIVEYVKDQFGSDLKPIYRKADMLWESYPQLFDGTFPLKKTVVQKEVTKYSRGSYDKAIRILGWQPKTNLRELFADTIMQIQSFV